MAVTQTKRNTGQSTAKEYQTPYGTVTTTRVIRTAEPSVVQSALMQAGLYRPPVPRSGGGIPWLWILAGLGGYWYLRSRGAVTAPPVGGTGSVPVTSSTVAPVPTALGTPVNLRMLGATAHSVIVATDPILGATGYKWYNVADNNLLAQSSTEVAVIQGLQQNTDYDVYLVATGPFGTQSQPSSPLLIKTTTGAPEGIAVSVNVPAVTVNLNVPVNANLTLQYIGPVNVPVTPTSSSSTPNTSAPSGVSVVPVSTSTQYAKPTSQIVDTPVGPAQALTPTAYSLGLPTHYSAAQVSQLSNGTVNKPAVMPIPLSPTLDPSSSSFNPQAIVETANEQSNPVPAGYPFASFAQSQEAINWWVRTHPSTPLPPDLQTVAQAWFAAGQPSG